MKRFGVGLEGCEMKRFGVGLEGCEMKGFGVGLDGCEMKRFGVGLEEYGFFFVGLCEVFCRFSWFCGGCACFWGIVIL